LPDGGFTIWGRLRVPKAAQMQLLCYI